MTPDKKDRYKTGIYAIVNIANGKMYIGKSENIYRRMIEHLSKIKRKIANRYLLQDWNKYGKDKFRYTIIEHCSKEELHRRECFWVLKLKTLNREYGYNLEIIDNDRTVVSKETSDKIKKSLKEYYSNNKVPKELIVDHAIKISKYSILQFDMNMNFIQEFPSKMHIRDYDENLDITKISRVCRGESYQFGNFIWRYKLLKTGEILHKFKKEPIIRGEVVKVDKVTKEIIETYPDAKTASNLNNYSSNSKIYEYCNTKRIFKKKSFYYMWKKEYLVDFQQTI